MTGTGLLHVIDMLGNTVEALKGELAMRDAEIEQLNAQIEQMTKVMDSTVGDDGRADV